MSSLSPTLGRVPAPSPEPQPGATPPNGAEPSGAERVQAPDSPAHARSTPVDGVAVLGAISPSRAADFATCPLLYRFRVVDRLPEPVSPQAARGTLVHKVLETSSTCPPTSAPLSVPASCSRRRGRRWWSRTEALAELAAQTDEAAGTDAWLAGCAGVLERWFTLEDPQRLEPAEREAYVEALLDSRLLLRGFVDRIDVAPDGAVRVVDYKTGRSPGRRPTRRRPCSRCASTPSCSGAPAAWCRRCSSWSTSATGRSSATPPTRTTCAPRSVKRRGVVARDPDGPLRRGLAPEHRSPLRLVLVQGAVPGVRRDAPAAARGRVVVRATGVRRHPVTGRAHAGGRTHPPLRSTWLTRHGVSRCCPRPPGRSAGAA